MSISWDPKDDEAALDADANDTTAELQRLQDALRASTVDIRSALGQQFSACHKKRNCRRRCVQPVCNIFGEGPVPSEMGRNTLRRTRIIKKHEKSFARIEASNGTYLPFGMVVHAEGGWSDASAIHAANLYCRKAIEMGGDWTTWNVMTERLEFLHVRKEFTDVFKEKWGLYQEWRSKPEEIDETPQQPQGELEKKDAQEKLAAAAAAKAKAKATKENKRHQAA